MMDFGQPGKSRLMNSEEPGVAQEETYQSFVGYFLGPGGFFPFLIDFFFIPLLDKCSTAATISHTRDHK
jgi:hypothetical protein